jgi:mannose-6-phosphate isomerase-like protein (cupin superfamily)
LTRRDKVHNAITVADVHDPSTVYGVHGTVGQSWWKCLSRTPGPVGPWEAVEWASLPPGGVSGEHQHSRTEEIYIVLCGHGEIALNGRIHPAGPGDVILTRVGDRHGLTNTGDEQLDWLVIELTARQPLHQGAGCG